MYLATISSQLGVEAAGKSLGHHPGVGGQGLGVDSCVQDGGVLRGECLAMAGQGESGQAADGEAFVLPGKAENSWDVIRWTESLLNIVRGVSGSLILVDADIDIGSTCRRQG